MFSTTPFPSLNEIRGKDLTDPELQTQFWSLERSLDNVAMEELANSLEICERVYNEILKDDAQESVEFLSTSENYLRKYKEYADAIVLEFSQISSKPNTSIPNLDAKFYYLANLQLLTKQIPYPVYTKSVANQVFSAFTCVDPVLEEVSG